MTDLTGAPDHDHKTRHASNPELLAAAEEIARAHGEQLTEPGDDWPHAFLIWRMSNDKPPAVGVVELPRSYTDKAGNAAMVGNFLRGRRATEAVLVCNAFFTVAEPGEDAMKKLPPRQDPNRQETLIFAAVTSLTTTLAMATITRHPDRPPTLGSVELMDGFKEYARVDIAAMQMAVRDNAADAN
jgi:hypothetical protein